MSIYAKRLQAAKAFTSCDMCNNRATYALCEPNGALPLLLTCRSHVHKVSVAIRNRPAIAA